MPDPGSVFHCWLNRVIGLLGITPAGYYSSARKLADHRQSGNVTIETPGFTTGSTGSPEERRDRSGAAHSVTQLLYEFLYSTAASRSYSMMALKFTKSGR
jgi:hypothetical protein